MEAPSAGLWKDFFDFPGARYNFANLMSALQLVAREYADERYRLDRFAAYSGREMPLEIRLMTIECIIALAL
jgi:hypothetical protein